MKTPHSELQLRYRLVLTCELLKSMDGLPLDPPNGLYLGEKVTLYGQTFRCVRRHFRLVVPERLALRGNSWFSLGGLNEQIDRTRGNLREGYSAFTLVSVDYPFGRVFRVVGGITDSSDFVVGS